MSLQTLPTSGSYLDSAVGSFGEYWLSDSPLWRTGRGEGEAGTPIASRILFTDISDTECFLLMGFIEEILLIESFLVIFSSLEGRRSW